MNEVYRVLSLHVSPTVGASSNIVWLIYPYCITIYIYRKGVAASIKLYSHRKLFNTTRIFPQLAILFEIFRLLSLLVLSTRIFLYFQPSLWTILFATSSLHNDDIEALREAIPKPAPCRVWRSARLRETKINRGVNYTSRFLRPSPKKAKIRENRKKTSLDSRARAPRRKKVVNFPIS